MDFDPNMGSRSSLPGPQVCTSGIYKKYCCLGLMFLSPDRPAGVSAGQFDVWSFGLWESDKP